MKSSVATRSANAESFQTNLCFRDRIGLDLQRSWYARPLRQPFAAGSSQIQSFFRTFRWAHDERPHAATRATPDAPAISRLAAIPLCGRPRVQVAARQPFSAASVIRKHLHALLYAHHATENTPKLRSANQHERGGSRQSAPPKTCSLRRSVHNGPNQAPSHRGHLVVHHRDAITGPNALSVLVLRGG